MFHKVFVEIEIPVGSFCFKVALDKGKRDNDIAPCSHIGVSDYDGEYCEIFHRQLSYVDDKEHNILEKCQECKALDKHRICINCGNYGGSWCELHKKEVLTSDTCGEFVYGSWK